MSIHDEYEPVVEILINVFGKYKFHNEVKGQISFDCPVCSYEIKGLDRGDGKGNLEVNYIDEVYKCWSCCETHSTYGTLYSLLKKHGNTKQLKKYNLLRPDSVENVRVSKHIIVKLPKEFISLKDVSPGFKITPHYRQVMIYLKNRNVTDEMITKYNIGFCYLGQYSYRVIIPSYNEDGDINYFIARSYLSKPKLKYKNPEAEKEIIIWNEHLINWKKTIYLVEGVFDSIFLPNSIPMLGKVLHQKLFNLLYEKAKKIVIILDPDAWNDQEKLYHKLNCGKLMGKIWCIKLEGNKDIAELKGELDNYIPKRLD